MEIYKEDRKEKKPEAFLKLVEVMPGFIRLNAVDKDNNHIACIAGIHDGQLRSYIGAEERLFNYQHDLLFDDRGAIEIYEKNIN